MSAYPTGDERQKRMEEIIREALRQSIEEGVIDDDVVMVADWAMVLDTIDTEGEPGTAFIHPFDQKVPEALKLMSLGYISAEERLRGWLRGDDE